MFYKTSKIKIGHVSAGNNAMVPAPRFFMSCTDIRAKDTLKIGTCGCDVI